MPNEWRRAEYLITTDPRRVDLDAVHATLTASYWATGITRELVARAIEHSLPFSLFHGDRLIGFARIISDYATFAYLADVFVLPEYRGRGLGVWMMETVVAHPALQGLRRWVLLTRDAHGLYRKVGFKELSAPDRYMELWEPNVYTKAGGRGPGSP